MEFIRTNTIPHDNLTETRERIRDIHIELNASANGEEKMNLYKELAMMNNVVFDVEKSGVV